MRGASWGVSSSITMRCGCTVHWGMSRQTTYSKAVNKPFGLNATESSKPHARPGDCDGRYWPKPDQYTLHFPELEDPDGVSVCPSTISLRATEHGGKLAFVDGKDSHRYPSTLPSTIDRHVCGEPIHLQWVVWGRLRKRKNPYAETLGVVPAANAYLGTRSTLPG